MLTVAPGDYEDEPDFELARMLPPGLPIHHTGAIPVRLTRAIGITDLALRSYLSMRRALRRLLRQRRPDALYFPGGPFYQFLLGAYANRTTGTPYVLDYTDPWVFPLRPQDDSIRKKIFWARRLAIALEPFAVRRAAHIFAVSDGTNDSIRHRYPRLPSTRFSAVPFGFERSDFDALRARPRPNPFWDSGDGNVHLAYVGAMLPRGYETLRALFGAVVRLREHADGPGRRLRLHFFGTTYDPNATDGLVLPTAREMGLGDIVTEHPRRVPYLDALNVLTSADVVLALGSTDHHYTASKIFPCLLSGRPVVAVYHEQSTVGEVMRAAGRGELVTYNDAVRAEDRIDELAAALARAAQPGRTTQPLDSNLLGQFSAEVMTDHLFDVLDEVAAPSGRRGATARSVSLTGQPA